MLTVITPYWYLSGQPTSEPEWTWSSGGREDYDGGSAIRLDQYAESLRLVHFMETLCTLSSSLRHVLNPHSDSKFDVVILVTEFDHGILHSAPGVDQEGFLLRYIRENKHMNIVTETVSNACGRDSYSLCADIQFGNSRSRVSVKKPEPIEVVMALNRVMTAGSRGGDIPRNHPYAAHISSSIIPVHSRDSYGHNWFYQAYHALTRPAESGSRGKPPVVVGSKVLSMDEGKSAV